MPAARGEALITRAPPSVRGDTRRIDLHPIVATTLVAAPGGGTYQITDPGRILQAASSARRRTPRRVRRADTIS